MKINNENNYFNCLEKRAFYIFSAKSLVQKIENIVYLSEITARTLTFRDGTADITYCADVTLFLHATSGGIPLTATFFWTDFSRSIALNAIWAHSLGTKLCFYPILYLLNTLNRTKLTRNVKKKLVF